MVVPHRAARPFARAACTAGPAAIRVGSAARRLRGDASGAQSSGGRRRAVAARAPARAGPPSMCANPRSPAERGPVAEQDGCLVEHQRLPGARGHEGTVHLATALDQQRTESRWPSSRSTACRSSRSRPGERDRDRLRAGATARGGARRRRPADRAAPACPGATPRADRRRGRRSAAACRAPPRSARCRGPAARRAADRRPAPCRRRPRSRGDARAAGAHRLRAGSPVIHLLSPLSAARRPSRPIAALSVTNGVPCATWCR